MQDQAVITACSIDLPVGEDSAILEKDIPFYDCSKHPWYSSMLEAKVYECTGARPEMAFLADDARARSGFALKRKSSVLLAQNLGRLIRRAGIRQSPKNLRIGIANNLSYSFFNSDEKVNLFNFKANLEHQTPALVGGCLDCFGPQFVAKEGDNSDLICIDNLTAALRYLPGPVMVAGISEPHPLLTTAELMKECGELEKAAPKEKVKINTRFTEGVASVFLETAEGAGARGCAPAARIAGSYQCLRNFDYEKPGAIEDHLARSLERTLKSSDGNIRAVFGCFRHNERIHDMELKTLSRLLPRARIINTTSFVGDASPISGLIDLFFAVSGFQSGTLPGGMEGGLRKPLRKAVPLSLTGGEILVQKISRFGHYAGVVIRDAS